MNNFFNKNSTGFLLRFALIMVLSFSVFFFVEYFEVGEKGSSASAPLNREM